jgi:O-antigen ligase
MLTNTPLMAEPLMAEPPRGATEPILGEASCRPLREGINSTAIRWVLYQEATAMLLTNPVWGVGAAKFGEHSCTGSNGFPHSTILQAFAEMGLIGGGLLVVLLVFCVITLIRPFLSVGHKRAWPADAFVLTLFVVFILADQFYGNYFMSVGMWLVVGITGSMQADLERQDDSNE